MNACETRGFAKFHDKFNETKAITYMVLIDQSKRGVWVRPRQIADATGLNLQSLLALMPRWCSWRRIQRRLRAGFYEYTITENGFRWFMDWKDFMPLQRYLDKIREWQEKHKPA